MEGNECGGRGESGRREAAVVRSTSWEADGSGSTRL